MAFNGDRDLQHMNLTETPTAIASLTTLNYLDLGNNLIPEIPPYIFNATLLQTLSYSHNKVSGSLPSEFGLLTSLTWLNLEYNMFTGTIPTEIGQLNQLVELQLDFNQLSGTLPTQLGELQSVQWLKISNNSISGGIPTELGALSAMTMLDVSSNNLNGTVPSQLLQLSNLGTVNLSYNHFVGDAPVFQSSNAIQTYLDYNCFNQLPASKRAANCTMTFNNNATVSIVGGALGGTAAIAALVLGWFLYTKYLKRSFQVLPPPQTQPPSSSAMTLHSEPFKMSTEMAATSEDATMVNFAGPIMVPAESKRLHPSDINPRVSSFMSVVLPDIETRGAAPTPSFAAAQKQAEAAGRTLTEKEYLEWLRLTEQITAGGSASASLAGPSSSMQGDFVMPVSSGKWGAGHTAAWFLYNGGRKETAELAVEQSITGLVLLRADINTLADALKCNVGERVLLAEAVQCVKHLEGASASGRTGEDLPAYGF
ncbi:hypothetical protein BC830DRAFT_1162922 [Chytriomyces sp. MP71]|nr:hypothetical protein BC830DRAFT_1162922 [Chytriomyces sp. MP71]